MPNKESFLTVLRTINSYKLALLEFAYINYTMMQVLILLAALEYLLHFVAF